MDMKNEEELNEFRSTRAPQQKREWSLEDEPQSKRQHTNPFGFDFDEFLGKTTTHNPFVQQMQQTPQAHQYNPFQYRVPQGQIYTHFEGLPSTNSGRMMQSSPQIHSTNQIMSMYSPFGPQYIPSRTPQMGWEFGAMPTRLNQSTVRQGHQFQQMHTPLDELTTLATVASAGNKRAPKTTATAQTKADPNKKKEGLEESSLRIIQLLQQRGKMIFKDIHETLGIDYRRAYDILNILLTTGLISKIGKKRENKLPFVYLDGTPLPETIEIRDLMYDIEREQATNDTLKQHIEILEAELSKEQPDLKTAIQRIKERDPQITSNPLYQDILSL